MIENEKITTSINPKKGQRILGQDKLCRVVRQQNTDSAAK